MRHITIGIDCKKVFCGWCGFCHLVNSRVTGGHISRCAIFGHVLQTDIEDRPKRCEQCLGSEKPKRLA
jgi:hypothetical protein